MDERPVEELIGWEPQLSSFYDEELTTRTELHSGWFVDGGAGFTRHRAEVDDMLEWLTGSWPGLDIEIYQDGRTVFDGWNVIVSITDHEALSIMANECAKTLRQALEAVVRAVAPDE